MYLEFLEQKAIAAAPLECKPRLWKRYVDDVLEIVKQDQVENLTQHLNSSDPAGPIKFTYEKEYENKISFLDSLIIRKPDGSVKLLVYRKPTHTDQYLHFDSHHSVHQKLGIIRTLFDHMNSIVTMDADRNTEEVNITSALSRCGYPKWSFNQVRKKMKENKKVTSKKKENMESKGFFVVPYVAGLSWRVSKCLRSLASTQL
ncbi:uncharacterized protein [Antedon mediterranea]|uniref:uncharacterized protein n=1 Tax=Antedon mediterranea TaxID=105859 RepID=UPI003AF72073